MAKNITVRKITDNELVNAIQDVAATAISKTKFWQKRPNSLTSAAQTVLQLAGIAGGLFLGLPWWGILIVALVIGVAEVIVQASTKTPVTPHSAEKLVETAVEKFEPDNISPVFSVYHEVM